MSEVNPPSWIQGQCYSGELDRALFDSIICAEGVVSKGDGDLLVTATPGSNNVSVAAGGAWIFGDVNGSNGIYYARNASAEPVTISSNSDPTNSRVDFVIASVYDAQYIGVASNWAIEVVQGVAGAGDPVIPDGTRSGWIKLGRVVVPAANAVPSVVDDSVREQMTLCSDQVTGAVPLTTTLLYTPSASGTGTFEKADYPGLRGIRVTGVGAGGGSGSTGATGAGAVASAAGGGGGGCFIKTYTVSDLSASEAYTIGVGGTGGATSGAPNAGAAGGYTTFKACTADGGGGGDGGIPHATLAQTATGGQGSSATGGDLNINGSDGMHARLISVASQTYVTIPAGYGGAGGGPFGGGMQGGSDAGSGANGLNGTQYGGGASGPRNSTASTAAKIGKNGHDGLLMIELIY